jgi:hypothetical protein
MIWLASKVKIPAMKHYIDPEAHYTKVESFIYMASLLAYMIARLGILALMFSSLRALPAGSYISIDWLASIPHI